MLSIIIILSIALAIFLGYRTKINTGLFCIVFAYIIGCFVMGLKPKQVIGFWPTNTMFVILSVSLFYNFAAINGTLEKMSGALLYACRNFPGLLPYALFAVAVILSVMGATYFTVLAFLAPITLVICDESRMDKLTGAVAINCGALAGGNFPTSNLGVVFRGLADTAYEASPDIAAVDSFNMEMKIFIFAIIFSLILITIFRFGFKENRNIGKGVTFKKPEAFTKNQKTTLTLMLAMMAVVLIFPLLNILMSENTAVKYISGKVDVGLVAIIFTVIALLLKLAPQKEAIARIPWNTIIMIAGAGMLIAVAVEAGTIEALSTWIGSNVPKPLVPIAFCLVGAIMSFFSSTTGVVAPALFPLIPNLAASVGLSAPVLFACTILGAQSSAISPFSSGGSLILGSTPKEEERNELFNRLLMVAVPISVITCTVYNFVIAMVLERNIRFYRNGSSVFLCRRSVFMYNKWRKNKTEESPMAKKSNRNTRGRIVSAAWKLFYEQGYEDTTVEEIIELSGTSKGSFYHYFDGKDALLSTLSSLFDEKYEELTGLLTPEMTAMEQLLFLNRELFHMIEDSISLDLLARLYSTQLTTNGEKHLLDHNRIYYKLLRKIIAKGQSEGQLSSRSNVNEMVKLYALCERALLYDWCLCAGEYALTEYSAKVLPGFLSSFLP